MKQIHYVLLLAISFSTIQQAVAYTADHTEHTQEDHTKHSRLLRAIQYLRDPEVRVPLALSLYEFYCGLTGDQPLSQAIPRPSQINTITDVTQNPLLNRLGIYYGWALFAGFSEHISRTQAILYTFSHLAGIVAKSLLSGGAQQIGNNLCRVLPASAATI